VFEDHSSSAGNFASLQEWFVHGTAGAEWPSNLYAALFFKANRASANQEDIKTIGQLGIAYNGQTQTEVFNITSLPESKFAHRDAVHAVIPTRYPPIVRMKSLSANFRL